MQAHSVACCSQEDIDHILKYGSALHGEWFLNGQRLPGGDHRKPLPAGLSEASSFEAPFPEMDATDNFTDGCPNQFDYGTNYHQAALWRAKTAMWALDYAKAQRAEAMEALTSKQAALRAAAARTPEKEAAATALATARSEAASVNEATKAVIDTDGLSAAITRTDIILIEHHGKGPCDAQSLVLKFTIKEAITTGKMLDPGTRELVLFMAEHKQAPSIAKANKAGWEAPQDYYYGFFDTAKFTKRAVPDATGFKGCRGHHVFHGACQDLELAERNGPLQVCKMFCACNACLVGQFDACIMMAEMGRMVRQPKGALRMKGAALSHSMMLSLEAFADALDAGWLVAVDADKAEHDLEGVYWLARLSGPAFVVPEDMVHSGQQYCEGWLVAPGQWYKLKQRSERGYELLEPKVWIVVNHMIRLKGLSFRGSQSGPQGRQLRTVDPTTGPAAAGRAHGSGLSFLEEEVHHEILAGAEYAAQEEAEAEAEAEAGNSS